jgi:hypothetical protein
MPVLLIFLMHIVVVIGRDWLREGKGQVTEKNWEISMQVYRK